MTQTISHILYNQLSDIESQSVALQQSSFASLWPELYNVVNKHNYLDRFGVAVLHRHLDLPPQHAMIHEMDAHGDDICRPEAIGMRMLYPSCYHLGHDLVQAYEFSSTPTTTPNAAFLTDMAALFRRHQLQDLLAVSYIQDKQSVWLERMTDDTDGTLSVRTPGEFDFPREDYIATEWAFDNTKDGPRMVTLKGCAKQENGGHLRTG